jgi:hypothetical protein
MHSTRRVHAALLRQNAATGGLEQVARDRLRSIR